DGTWGLPITRSMPKTETAPEGAAYARLLTGGRFGQTKHLPRIDPIGVPDLAGIGLIDGRVLDAFAINAPRNGPEVVATSDDGLARGNALRFRVTDGNRDQSGHGRLGISGGSSVFRSRFCRDSGSGGWRRVWIRSQGRADFRSRPGFGRSGGSRL